MSVTLPSELLRKIFYFSRSPTAWIIRQEFARRTQEEADLEAHEDAAERFSANQEAENEREAFELYSAEQDKEEEEDLQWYYDEAPDQCGFGIEGDWW
jgi:hypothetical protein